MEHVVYTEYNRCRQLWENIWPVKSIFDLWQVRSCFHEAYANPMQFHTIEQDGEVLGFLPLSWSPKAGRFVQFPGETWQGKTWLEQNRVIARDWEIYKMLLDAVPGSLNLRYLSWHPILDRIGNCSPDEVGYLFYPGMYNYSFDNYWLGFSGKTRKKIKREQKKLDDCHMTFRFNEVKDLDHMFLMNRQSFAGHSYFDDPKFYNAVFLLVSWLRQMGMLRIVAILIAGEVAAVDIGGVFNNTYTLFAGGTNPEFGGVAKIINLHHMEWACRKRFDTVDFLCGDFNWKTRFHLSPRPLYEITIDKTVSGFVPRFEWNINEKADSYA